MKKIYRLEPKTFANVWGGNRLREYGKISDEDRIGESWELSFVKGNEALADGTPLTELFPKELWGTRAERFDFFPVLTKFIDAKEKLSVQVHPSDEYALKNEGQYGKSEMWYVVSADEGAGICLGFNAEYTKDEIEKAVADGRIEGMLTFKKVKAGDSFFIPAGTVHAICGGVLIFEVQQNSTLTYRLYDYLRRDQSGNLRELHVDRALEVLQTGAYPDSINRAPEGADERLLAECECFKVTEYTLNEDEIRLTADSSSFTALTVISGECTVAADEENETAKHGDSFFIPAQNEETEIRIFGNGSVIKIEI